MVPKSPPTFFKVLIDASAPHLPLPPDFVTFHLKNNIPKDTTIQTGNGGYSWKLKIEKVNEFYCFTHGWKDVVKDVNLGFGDFLVFSQIDDSIFNVLIFSPNGCQKDLPKNSKVQKSDGSDEVVDDVDKDGVDVNGNDEEDDDAFFMPTMTKNNRTTLPLTMEFVRLAGINSTGSIQIKNLDGEEFSLALRTYRSPASTKKYFLSTGWLDFRRTNNLLDGDKCIVKFLKKEGKLCLAKIPDPSPCRKFSREHNSDVEADCDDEQANSVIKRPQGRPPKRHHLKC